MALESSERQRPCRSRTPTTALAAATSRRHALLIVCGIIRRLHFRPGFSDVPAEIFPPSALPTVKVDEARETEPTLRGEGSFGHTGVKIAVEDDDERGEMEALLDFCDGAWDEWCEIFPPGQRGPRPGYLNDLDPADKK